jgi:gliding motility-associated-like protein
VYRYKVYYSPYEEDPLQLLAITPDTFFVHSSLASLAGCYTITAVDRSGNESDVISKTCIDNCVEFRLPNLITPNNDSLNDQFTPSCFSRAFIQNVHFSVFNRWGKKIFEDDVPPEINWSGLSEGNSVTVVPGVYYYIAEVKAWRLRRKDENMKFTGWVQIVK